MSRVNMRLVRFLLAICVLTSAFFYSFDVKADTLNTNFTDSISERVTFDLVDNDATYHQQWFYFYNLGGAFYDITEKGYYKANYSVTCNVNFSDFVGSLDTFTLTLDAYDPADHDYISFVLFNNNEPKLNDDSFVFSDSGCFIFAGKFSGLDTFTSSISFSVSNVDGSSETLTYDFVCNLSIDSIESLSSEDADSYLSGYNQGYDEGLTDGFLSGEASGFDTGYNAGLSDGFEEGKQSGYSDGFLAGKDSVDTDIYFEQGYESGFSDGLIAGSSSVDTDSYFQAGYNQGHNDGYTEGYDDGYSRGYAEAFDSLETSNSTTLAAGTSQTYSFSHNFRSDLSIRDANTPFSSHIEGSDGKMFHFNELDSLLSKDSEYLEEITGTLTGDTDYWDFNYVYTHNMGSIKSLFKASPDVFAYKIILKPSRVSLQSEGLVWLRSMIGTYSDVQACKGEYGHLFVNGSTQNSSIWLVTDYSDIYICLGYLSYFLDDGELDTFYSLDWNFDIEVIPYTKNEFNAAVPAIEKQTLELQKQTEAMKQEMNDLKNGYDSSSADKMNDDFSASLTDYQTTEDSLFNSAKGGLDSFTFVDFASYPLLVTSMSFTTSLMTAVYNAMGGNSGPFGIVLSILFSVMLVAMVIGLSRFFKSGGKGDD